MDEWLPAVLVCMWDLTYYIPSTTIFVFLYLKKESTNSELAADTLKLIHAGKVLKDDQSIDTCGIKPNDFLVVMVTKPKKAPAAAAVVPAAAAAATAPPTPAAASSTTPAETPAAAATTTPAAPSRPSSEPEFSEEVLSNLTGMGFPEAEVKHCLRAANGNPDVAVEFLTNGIPDGLDMTAAGGGGSESPAAGSSSGGAPLVALRNHPQFNDLRRLVQSNPQMLQTVLTQIGQQQPELLAEINANQGIFLEMMNEPITETSSSSVRAPVPSSSSSGAGGAGAGFPPGMMDGMANPAQMAQMIQSMSPNELNQMAQMMGLSSDQLRTTAQMLGQIPPEQLQQYMLDGGGGLGGLFGAGGGGGGGGHGGQQVLRLTEEEMAAVDRLTEMGFDRSEAAQAFLACDKNEALAANLLMDSMADGDGGGWEQQGGDDGGNGGGGGGNDDGDDMYD
jgi:UV excision repair protein RAD23